MFDLTGRVALVTGAGTGGGSGTGAGISQLLAASGAAIAVNDYFPERAEDTVDQIRAAGGTAEVVSFDVTEYEAVGEGIQQIERSLGPVDILINNAGNGVVNGMEVKPFRESDPSSWSNPLDVNFYGVLNCIHQTINGMIARGWGRVVTISSGSALIGLRQGVSVYAGSKGAAISFMRHLAVESGGTGVTANTVAVGFQTPMEWRPAHDRIVRATPAGRLGRPEDIGAFVLYLASDEAEWMTGQTFQLNGGGTTT
jgi:3-oxoacyl-[acyl-carrier protein] reductase